MHPAGTARASRSKPERSGAKSRVLYTMVAISGPGPPQARTGAAAQPLEQSHHVMGGCLPPSPMGLGGAELGSKKLRGV